MGVQAAGGDELLRPIAPPKVSFSFSDAHPELLSVHVHRRAHNGNALPISSAHCNRQFKVAFMFHHQEWVDAMQVPLVNASAGNELEEVIETPPFFISSRQTAPKQRKDGSMCVVQPPQDDVGAIASPDRVALLTKLSKACGDTTESAARFERDLLVAKAAARSVPSILSRRGGGVPLSSPPLSKCTAPSTSLAGSHATTAGASGVPKATAHVDVVTQTAAGAPVNAEKAENVSVLPVDGGAVADATAAAAATEQQGILFSLFATPQTQGVLGADGPRGNSPVEHCEHRDSNRALVAPPWNQEALSGLLTASQGLLALTPSPPVLPPTAPTGDSEGKSKVAKKRKKPVAAQAEDGAIPPAPTPRYGTRRQPVTHFEKIEIKYRIRPSTAASAPRSSDGSEDGQQDRDENDSGQVQGGGATVKRGAKRRRPRLPPSPSSVPPDDSELDDHDPSSAHVSVARLLRADAVDEDHAAVAAPLLQLGCDMLISPSILQHCDDMMHAMDAAGSGGSGGREPVESAEPCSDLLPSLTEHAQRMAAEERDPDNDAAPLESMLGLARSMSILPAAAAVGVSSSPNDLGSMDLNMSFSFLSGSHALKSNTLHTLPEPGEGASSRAVTYHSSGSGTHAPPSKPQ